MLEKYNEVLQTNFTDQQEQEKLLLTSADVSTGKKKIMTKLSNNSLLWFRQTI